MACPYFYPLDPEDKAHSAHQDSMLPLGGRWRGICRADTATEPDGSVRPTCNLGYARGVCARFPAGDGPDAVRFTVTRDEGDRLLLYYVIERDHHPFAHGPLEYAFASGAIASPAGDTLARQAQAYAESYRRRKGSQETPS